MWGLDTKQKTLQQKTDAHDTEPSVPTFDSRSTDPKIVTQEDLKRVENQLGLLLKIVVVQTVLLAALLISYLIPNILLYLQVGSVMLLVMIGVYLFRKQIPHWLGEGSRKVFAIFSGTQRKS